MITIVLLNIFLMKYRTMDVTILGGVGYDKERQQQNLKFKRKKGDVRKSKKEMKKKALETYGDARVKEIDGRTEGFYNGTQLALYRGVIDEPLLR